MLLRSRGIINFIIKIRPRALNTRSILKVFYITLYFKSIKAFLLTTSLNYIATLYVELKASIIVINKLIEIRVIDIK